MCERLEEARVNMSSRDTILYIHTSCQWRIKREKYLFRNERRGNVRGLRVYLHAPSKPPRRDIAKTTREKKKKVFLHPDVKARHGPFFQSECQEQDQQSVS